MLQICGSDVCWYKWHTPSNVVRCHSHPYRPLHSQGYQQSAPKVSQALLHTPEPQRPQDPSAQISRSWRHAITPVQSTTSPIHRPHRPNSLAYYLVGRESSSLATFTISRYHAEVAAGIVFSALLNSLASGPLPCVN